jgi:putative colanic acid biosynthesis glycosyltransferase
MTVSQSRPLISIVTICFNDLHGLKKTISSLESQTSKAFQHWIIDGGSTDGTKEFLTELKATWPLHWISEKDKGIYDAMNKGVTCANGEFLWFINSGDYLADAAVIADIAMELKSHPEVDLFYGKIYFENENGRRLLGRPVKADEFLRDMPISTPATLFRRGLLLEKAFAIEYKIISDWISIKSIFESGVQTRFIDRVLSVFNLEGISSNQLWKILSEKLSFERRLIPRLKLILRSGSKYAVLSLFRKVGLLSTLRKWQHRS